MARLKRICDKLNPPQLLKWLFPQFQLFISSPQRTWWHSIRDWFGSLVFSQWSVHCRQLGQWHYFCLALIYNTYLLKTEAVVAALKSHLKQGADSSLNKKSVIAPCLFGNIAPGCHRNFASGCWHYIVCLPSSYSWVLNFRLHRVSQLQLARKKSRSVCMLTPNGTLLPDTMDPDNKLQGCMLCQTPGRIQACSRVQDCDSWYESKILCELSHRCLDYFQFQNAFCQLPNFHFPPQRSAIHPIWDASMEGNLWKARTNIHIVLLSLQGLYSILQPYSAPFPPLW